MVFIQNDRMTDCAKSFFHMKKNNNKQFSDADGTIEA